MLKATKVKCQQSKCKVQMKESTFRDRFAFRFKNLVARDMKTANSHIFKVFQGVVEEKFLTGQKNQNLFNGWIFFDWRINLMLSQPNIQPKMSGKMCYTEFIKIEIKGFEQQLLFDIKQFFV